MKDITALIITQMVCTTARCFVHVNVPSITANSNYNAALKQVDVAIVDEREAARVNKPAKATQAPSNWHPPEHPADARRNPHISDSNNKSADDLFPPRVSRDRGDPQ